MKLEHLLAVQDVQRKAANGEARSLRLAAGLTLGDMGEVCEVSSSTVARWEQGHRKPRGWAAVRYARALDRLEHLTGQSEAVG